MLNTYFSFYSTIKIVFLQFIVNEKQDWELGITFLALYNKNNK